MLRSLLACASADQVENMSFASVLRSSVWVMPKRRARFAQRTRPVAGEVEDGHHVHHVERGNATAPFWQVVA